MSAPAIKPTAQRAVHRAVRRGSPKGTPIAERIARLTVKRGPNDCWDWTGQKSQSGYARLLIAGKMRRVSRLVWEQANEKPFPEGQLACHTCDNPACVNPAHIWAGTQKDNIHDMLAKGRRSKSHCRHGHPYSEEGKPPCLAGKSWCPTCYHDSRRRRTARNAERRRQAREAKPRVATGRSDAGHPYPIWLNADAKALLARVVADKPERTKQLAEWSGVGEEVLGYRGKAAAALRAIWTDWFMETSRWCDAAGVGTDLYHKRRNALLAYAKKHSADAVIARELGL